MADKRKKLKPDYPAMDEPPECSSDNSLMVPSGASEKSGIGYSSRHGEEVVKKDQEETLKSVVLRYPEEHQDTPEDEKVQNMPDKFMSPRFAARLGPNNQYVYLAPYPRNQAQMYMPFQPVQSVPCSQSQQDFLQYPHVQGQIGQPRQLINQAGQHFVKIAAVQNISQQSQNYPGHINNFSQYDQGTSYSGQPVPLPQEQQHLQQGLALQPQVFKPPTFSSFSCGEDQIFKSALQQQSVQNQQQPVTQAYQGENRFPRNYQQGQQRPNGPIIPSLPPPYIFRIQDKNVRQTSPLEDKSSQPLRQIPQHSGTASRQPSIVSSVDARTEPVKHVLVPKVVPRRIEATLVVPVEEANIPQPFTRSYAEVVASSGRTTLEEENSAIKVVAPSGCTCKEKNPASSAAGYSFKLKKGGKKDVKDKNFAEVNQIRRSYAEVVASSGRTTMVVPRRIEATLEQDAYKHYPDQFVCINKRRNITNCEQWKQNLQIDGKHTQEENNRTDNEEEVRQEKRPISNNDNIVFVNRHIYDSHVNKKKKINKSKFNDYETAEFAIKTTYYHGQERKSDGRFLREYEFDYSIGFYCKEDLYGCRVVTDHNKEIITAYPK